jgi:hypothetical protein
MRRREFIGKAGIGSAALAIPALGKTAPGTTARAGSHLDLEHNHAQEREDPTGALASATVSFGAWDTETPLDRFPNNSPRNNNYHHLLPRESVIRSGGSVNFIISGFHHVLIYAPGTKPEDINLTLLAQTTVQPGPPLINDPANRVYRGLDPSVFPLLPGGANPPQPMQDRVEVARLAAPGRYLVICGVLPHFFDAATGQFIMYGYVRVVGA